MDTAETLLHTAGLGVRAAAVEVLHHLLLQVLFLQQLPPEHLLQTGAVELNTVTSYVAIGHRGAAARSMAIVGTQQLTAVPDVRAALAAPG